MLSDQHECKSPSTTPPLNDPANNDVLQSSRNGIIIGVIVGVVVLITIVSLIVFLVKKSRKPKQKKSILLPQHTTESPPVAGDASEHNTSGTNTGDMSKDIIKGDNDEENESMA